MKKTKIKYQVKKDDLQFAFELDYQHHDCGEFYDYEIEDMAQEAAEDFFNNHDGWEYKWPIEFFIYSEEGKLLGSCSVEQEVEPVFVASFNDAPQNSVEQNGHIAQQHNG